MEIKMKRICVVTGTRAEYGLLRPLLCRIKADTGLELCLIVTGMHLSPAFGLTFQEIEQDGFTAYERNEMLLSSDTKNGVAKSAGLGMIGFSDIYARVRPDMVVLLGDRYEIFSAAAAEEPLHGLCLHGMVRQRQRNRRALQRLFAGEKAVQGEGHLSSLGDGGAVHGLGGHQEERGIGFRVKAGPLAVAGLVKGEVKAGAVKEVAVHVHRVPPKGDVRLRGIALHTDGNHLHRHAVVRAGPLHRLKELSGGGGEGVEQVVARFGLRRQSRGGQEHRRRRGNADQAAEGKRGTPCFCQGLFD